MTPEKFLSEHRPDAAEIAQLRAEYEIAARALAEVLKNWDYSDGRILRIGSIRGCGGLDLYDFGEKTPHIQVSNMDDEVIAGPFKDEESAVRAALKAAAGGNDGD